MTRAASCLAQVFQQRSRWAKGHWQIFWSPLYNPLLRFLPWPARWHYGFLPNLRLLLIGFWYALHQSASAGIQQALNVRVKQVSLLNWLLAALHDDHIIPLGNIRSADQSEPNLHMLQVRV